MEAVFEFVRQARERKDPVAGYQAIVETQKFLEKSFASAEHARAYLWFGSAYATLEPAAGFELVGSAIKRANQSKDLVELATTPKMLSLGGKSTQAILVADARCDFRPGFRALSKLNLTQSLSLAETFENKFFRGLAVLATASSIINSEGRTIDPDRGKTRKPKTE